MTPDSEILSELSDAGLVVAAAELAMEPVERNPDRIDFTERSDFIVRQGSATHFRMQIGNDLSELARRTSGFAEACPGLACGVLLWRRLESRDLLVTEQFDGVSVELLVSEGSLSADRCAGIADFAIAQLDLTVQPSSEGTAMRELDQLFGEVESLRWFQALDASFFRSFVFPFIRDGVLAGPFLTRWTNGDFNAGNLLVSRDGAVRLVDCEFARRTHFPVEDAWRWKIYSRLPAEALEVPSLRPAISGDPAWSEALFILRQLCLAEKTFQPVAAADDAGHRLVRLADMMAARGFGAEATAFRRRFGPDFAEKMGLKAIAQLYWHAHGRFSEDQVCNREYPVDRESILRFDFGAPSTCPLELRLDPVRAPGTVAITQLRFITCDRMADAREPLPVSEWPRLTPGGGGRLSGTDTGAMFVSVDNDPSILLSAPAGVRGLEVALHYFPAGSSQPTPGIDRSGTALPQ
jgi:hypothetical protein